MAAAPESQPASQLRPVPSPLLRNHSELAQLVSGRYPLVHPIPPPSISSSAHMPDILQEPAYIPYMHSWCKEMAHQYARLVTKASTLGSLYSPCLRVFRKVLLSVVLRVRE